MSILAIGGAGFIGRRMIPILVAQGHEVTCMDIDVASATKAFEGLGDAVKIVRGDVTQFDDVIGAMMESKAERVINLSYFIGELAPHVVDLGMQDLRLIDPPAQIAVFVDLTQIASDKKAVWAQFLGRFFRHLPIALEDIWSPDLDLSDLTLRDCLAGVAVGDLYLHAR